MKITYKTQGTCSSHIEVEVEDDVIQQVFFWGGCNGNLQGISRLVKGMKVEEVLQKLEGDELTLKHGEHGYVNSTTNFIALHDGKTTVQISPFQSGGGPNGVGGITVEGTPTGLKMETDKKGITRLSMNVTGNGISAQVTVTLSPSDNRATATIISNFNSLNVTLDGRLVPFKESSVFKGTTF